MVAKYRDRKVNKKTVTNFESLAEISLAMLPKMRKLMETYRVSDAIEEILVLARAANKYIDITKPWELFKDETKQDELDHVLYNLLETIRFIAIALKPFLPETANKIIEQLEIRNTSFESLKTFGLFEEKLLKSPEVLFERYDLTEKIKEIIEG